MPCCCCFLFVHFFFYVNVISNSKERVFCFWYRDQINCFLHISRLLKLRVCRIWKGTCLSVIRRAFELLSSSRLIYVMCKLFIWASDSKSSREKQSYILALVWVCDTFLRCPWPGCNKNLLILHKYWDWIFLIMYWGESPTCLHITTHCAWYLPPVG